MSIARQVSRAMLSRYSHVRMEAKRRALDEIAARQRAADERCKEEAACDELDGVKDGVLSDPRRCHFDPPKLLCAGADT